MKMPLARGIGQKQFCIYEREEFVDSVLIELTLRSQKKGV